MQKQSFKNKLDIQRNSYLKAKTFYSKKIPNEFNTLDTATTALSGPTTTTTTTTPPTRPAALNFRQEQPAVVDERNAAVAAAIKYYPTAPSDPHCRILESAV